MRPVRVMVLAVAALLAAGARAQSLEEMSRAREFVKALAADDTAALTEIVDFERRAAERLARGLDVHHWADLDEEGQQLAIQFAIEEWGSSAKKFDHSSSLVSVDAVPDPDAGLGPVPNRHILRLVLRRPSTAEYRDLLLTLAPDLKVIDLQQGEPYQQGSNPAGPTGLLPQRMLAAPSAGVRWPENVDGTLRDQAAHLVDAFLAAQEGPAATAALETLHRMGRPAVAALVERLLQLEAAVQPNGAGAARLVAALAHITGHVPAGSNPASATPPSPADVADWAAWHAESGWTFVPQPLEGIATTPAQPDVPEPPPTTAPAPPPRPDPSLPGPASTDPTRPLSGPRDMLLPAAADLPLRYAGKRVTGREVEARLAPSLRAALNDWAETCKKLGLQVVSTGRADHLVLGAASDKQLDQVAAWLDVADAMLDPIIPLLAPRETRATVAFVFDEKGQRSPAWAGLLDDLATREIVYASSVERLLKSPAGLTRRQAPLFIQLTWDLTGEGEFQLGNEVVGKFAQCLVTSRVGELPPEVLWGLNDVAEIRLFKSVYQYDTTGFVFSADHWDWAVRTRQTLEKAQRAKDFSLAALVADDKSAGGPTEPQMMTWALLDWLCDEHPADLHQLLADLAAVQDALDPLHHEAAWLADRAHTVEALSKTLGTIDPRKIETRLDLQAH